MQVAEQRRRIVKTSRGKHHRWLPADCSFSYSLIDQSPNALQLHRSDNRANVNCFVERRPGAKRTHTVAHFGNQRLSDAFLHQQSRSSAANLPLIEPDAVDQSLDCAVEVGVLENNKRRLPARFGQDPLVSRGAPAANRPPPSTPPGKPNS